MRKLTTNELKRNRLYDTIANANFQYYEVQGHVKQGMLLEDSGGNHVIVKAILKKERVDFEKEAIERPTEQPKEVKEEDTKE